MRPLAFAEEHQSRSREFYPAPSIDALGILAMSKQNVGKDQTCPRNRLDKSLRLVGKNTGRGENVAVWSRLYGESAEELA